MSEARNANADARAAILASISRSLAASRPFDTEHQKHHRPSAPPVTPTVPVLRLETLIENFRSSLTFVGADCRVVHGRQEAAAEVRAVIESHSAKQIAVSDSSMVAELMPDIKGIEILKNAAPSVLFGCDLGITSAQWGIAETGTLVLESERESHRLTSLVPPVHLCILKATDIRQTLGEILELISKNLSRTVTFITGASRTSDIELTLAIGVHGPKELHIIVIND
jgi:L-lactate utilization protein LutC